MEADGERWAREGCKLANEARGREEGAGKTEKQGRASVGRTKGAQQMKQSQPDQLHHLGRAVELTNYVDNCFVSVHSKQGIFSLR